jgi:hypothetical protein
MKFLYSLILLAMILVLPVHSYASSLGDMRTSLVQGDVQIKIPETGEWAPLAANTPLLEGDELWVPEGARAELQLNTNTYVRLDENSAFQILRLERDAPQFYVSQGHAYVYYNAPRVGVIQVDTPAASIRCYESSVFRIDIPDQYTDVSVYKGSVYVENELGRTRVMADYTLSVGPGTEAELAPLGPPDDWEVWNKGRNDRVFARKVSYDYLPSELRPYAYDFDYGGRWVDVPEYGHCWTPTLGISVGWAPYRHGRWTWVGGEYVWISYEPWGWAPYHYGRWAFVARFGWCWVPPAAGQVYWAPGYVAWVSTPGYVAWVPLAPGDLYYGRGYYGRNSVNITHINITQVHVTNVYKNVHVNNAITVVSENGFITGRHRPISEDEIRNIRQNRFMTRRISVAGPQIKPRKTSYFPVVRAIPAAKLPPGKVRSIRVKELRQVRPLVKEQGRSVFKPKAKPGELTVRKIPTPRSLPERMKGREQFRPAEQGRPAISPRSTKEEKGRMEKPVVTPQTRGRSEIRSVPERSREQKQPPVVTPQTRGKSEIRSVPERSREQKQPPVVTPQTRGRSEIRSVPERSREQKQPPVVTPQTRGRSEIRSVPERSREQKQPPVVTPQTRGGSEIRSAPPRGVKEQKEKRVVAPEAGKGRKQPSGQVERKSSSPGKSDEGNQEEQPFEERQQKGKRMQNFGR